MIFPPFTISRTSQFSPTLHQWRPKPCAADYFGDYQLIQCITVQVKERKNTSIVF